MFPNATEVLVDDGDRWEDAAALFEHATYRVERPGTEESLRYRGTQAVLGFCRQTRIYEDGTPRAKHVVTNVKIAIDGDTAVASSYVTDFQQTEVLPLQPIASVHYVDRFERAGEAWRFTERLITGFLLEDRGQHVDWHDGAPASSGVGTGERVASPELHRAAGTQA